MDLVQDKKSIVIINKNDKCDKNKKVTTEKVARKRITIEKMNVPLEYFSFDVQMEIIRNLHAFSLNKSDLESKEKIALSQLERKLCGYKAQDVDKTILDPLKLIKIKEIIDLLVACELKCFYCKEKVFVLYENVRDKRQWTLDRVDNDFGHNSGNVIIACLECNLRRRCRSKEKYLFTKELVIVKQGIDKQGIDKQDIDKQDI